MEPRRTLLMSGGATVAAGIAVACVFAVSHAAALTDSAGVPVGAGPIVVRSTVTPAPSPTATARPTPAPAATPEVVPAPDPEDVAAPAPQKPAPKPTVAPSAPPLATEADEAMLAELVEAGDWRAALAWVASQGWDEQKVQQWIAKLREEFDASIDRKESPTSSKTTNQTSASADHTSDRVFPKQRFGSKKEQSAFSPDRRD